MMETIHSDPVPSTESLTNLMSLPSGAHQTSPLSPPFLTSKGDTSCVATASNLEKQLITGFIEQAAHPYWSLQQATKTLKVLNNSHRLGLKKQKYCLPEIANIIRNWDNISAPSREFVLNLAASRILLHQRYGILNATKYTNQTPELLEFFHSQEAGLDNALESLQPSSPAYQPLLIELAKLTNLAEAGGLPRLEIFDNTVSRSSLEHFLIATGDLKNYTTPPPNEETFKEAIKQFQFRHGLIVDGIVGQKTLASMQAPLSVYIDQIEATLERIRADGYTPAPKSVVVNIPAFNVYGLTSGKTAITSKVIVGTQRTQTIPFQDSIEYIDINPSWYIPRSIVKGEMLHELQQNPEDLASKGILVVTEHGYTDVETIDWSGLTPEEASRHRLVQKPGPSNPLGNLKIIFPNEHQIYLHDTPFKHLFASPVRKFSHGCVRVEQAYSLASFILSTQQGTQGDGIDVAEIVAIVKSKKRKVIRVDPPVPVYLVYHTVDTWTDGPPRFLDDTYGWNKALISALKNL